MRVIVDGNGVVKERNDYYPFGARHVSKDYAQLAANRWKYNGKEEQVTGDLKYLDYGARMYDSGLGRWFGVDPKSEKYISISPYTYCYNNVINAFDPNGMDGVLLVWKDYPAGGVSYTGHAGVLLIDNKTGATKYYEYGRYDALNLGKVMNYAVPDVLLDRNRPTVESLNKAIKFISEKSGQKGGKVYDVTGAYFVSDKFSEMNVYASEKLKENDNAGRKKYSLLSNNCGDFAIEVLKQDANISRKTPGIGIPAPWILIEQYLANSDYNFTYNYEVGITIKYDDKTVLYDEKNSKTTTSQSWWQRLWHGRKD